LWNSFDFLLRLFYDIPYNNSKSQKNYQCKKQQSSERDEENEYLQQLLEQGLPIEIGFFVI